MVEVIKELLAVEAGDMLFKLMGLVQWDFADIISVYQCEDHGFVPLPLAHDLRQLHNKREAGSDIISTKPCIDGFHGRRNICLIGEELPDFQFVTEGAQWC